MLDETQDAWSACALPLYTLDADGRVQALNPALASLLGWRGQASDLPPPTRLPDGGVGLAARRLWRVPGAPGKVLGVTERLTSTGLIWGAVVIEDSAPPSATGAHEEPMERDAELLALSHELRSPLNAILGFADVLCHASAPPLQKDQLAAASHIAAAGERLLLQLDGLLDLARLRSKRLEMHFVRASPSDVWQDAQQALADELRMKGVSVDTMLATQEAANAMLLDPARLQQLMAHLLAWMLRGSRSGDRLQAVLELGIDGATRWSLQGPHPQGLVLQAGVISPVTWALCSLLAEQHGASLRALPQAGGELMFQLSLPRTPPATAPIKPEL